MNFLMAVILTFMPAYSASATIDQATLDFYAQNNILFYDPTATAQNFCSSGGDCFISGNENNRDEIYWSGLRNAGFTPEQTAGIMGNLFSEASSPTRQEQVYINARNNHCKTQQGREYSIWEDKVDPGVTHSGCIERYSAGDGVAGIGLGIVQWTSHDRRRGFLNTMSEMGLLKYFDGKDANGEEAYNTWGTFNYQKVKDEIVNQTGSDRDYWALWCAQFKYIWTEMHTGRFAAFFDQPNNWEKYAAFTSEVYEDCSGCEENGPQWKERVKRAGEFWNKYQNGDYDAIENGTAPVLISPSGSSTSANSDVLIIGDSLIENSQSSILAKMPNAKIVAQDSKQFIGDDPNNPSALQILEQYESEGKLSDYIVIALGTDGAKFTFDDGEKISKAVGLRKVFFVNDFDANDKNKYEDNNKEFTAVTNPESIDNAGLIDWKTTAENKALEYLEDGIVPTTAGADALANLIGNAVGGVKPTNTCNADVLNGELVFYSQSDAPWGNMVYGNKSSCSKMSQAGCAPTALAMIITNMTGQRVTPDVIAKRAIARGDRNAECTGGTSSKVAEVVEEYGLKVKNYGSITANGPLTNDEISQHIRQGEVFFASGINVPGLFSENGHFIGIYAVTPDGKWKIFDGGNSGNNSKEFDPSFVRRDGNTGLHYNLWGISRQ